MAACGRAVLGAAVLALAAVAILVAVRAGCTPGRDGFVSPEAARVHAQASGVFAEKAGAPTYSDYKRSVGGADPVTFREIRRLHAGGELTPAAVDAVLR